MYFKRRIQLGGVSDPWMLRAQEQLEEVYRLAPPLKNSRTLEEAARLEEQIGRERELARKESKRRKAMGYDVALHRGLREYAQGEYRQSLASFEDALACKPGSKEAIHAVERARVKVRELDVAGSLDESLKENRDLIINKYVTEQQHQAEAGQQ